VRFSRNDRWTPCKRRRRGWFSCDTIGGHHKILRGDVPWINLLRKVDEALILVRVEEHLEKYHLFNGAVVVV
jgi:hypothetical protein